MRVHSDNRCENRTHGWAPIGTRPSIKGHYLRGTKYSSIAGISLSGLLAHYTIKGGFKTDDLTYFLKTFLLPSMLPYPHHNSVLVMDNASTHRTKKVINLVESYGVRILYLPPYSPTFNPIENMFSKFKKFLQRYGGYLRQVGCEDTDLIYIAFRSITLSDIAGYFRVCGYFN